MAVQRIPQNRKDKKDLPRQRQDSSYRYEVTEKMKKNGKTSDRHPVHIPELKMVVYIKDKTKEAEIRAKYLDHANNYTTLHNEKTFEYFCNFVDRDNVLREGYGFRD